MTSRTILSCLLLPFLPLAQTGAAIVVTYHGEDAPNVFGPLNSLPFATDLDINGDGVADFFLHRGSFTAAMQGYNGNRFISVLATPPDRGGYIVPIPAGSLIGPDTTSLLGNWHHYTDNASNPALSTGFGLGLMQSVDAYIGVEFKVLDEIHYGWIHYIGFSAAQWPIFDENGEILGYIDGMGFPGGFINSWAYNSIPGEPIRAGEIPEPATTALLAGLASLLFAGLVRRRRRRMARLPCCCSKI